MFNRLFCRLIGFILCNTVLLISLLCVSLKSAIAFDMNIKREIKIKNGVNDSVLLLAQRFHPSESQTTYFSFFLLIKYFHLHLGPETN